MALHDKSGAPPVSHRRFLFACLIPAASAFLLCLPYYLKMFQLFRLTAGRGGDNYDFATIYVFNGFDTLGSLIFPPSAQAEGWYFFGFAGLSLLVLYGVGVLFEFRKFRRDKLLIAIILIWSAIITYITYGKISYLFDFLYAYLPGFDSLRVWGRLNIVLLPILALGLGRAYLYFEGILSDSASNQQRRTRCFKIALAAAILTGLLQSWLYSNEIYDHYWAVLLNYLGGSEWQFIALNLTIWVLLALCLFLSSQWPLKAGRSRLFLVFFLSALTFAELALYGGARQWIVVKNVDSNRHRRDISAYLRQSFEVPRIRKYFTLKYPHFNVGMIHEWYFGSYQDFYRRVIDDFGNSFDDTELSYFNRLMGVSEAKRLFVSSRIDHSSISDFLIDSERTESSGQHQIEILHYDGDSLEFTLISSGAGFVSFIDNWDPDWKAYVNGREVPIQKLFSTFKSISLEPGFNEVRFSYEPFSLW